MVASQESLLSGPFATELRPSKQSLPCGGAERLRKDATPTSSVKLAFYECFEQAARRSLLSCKFTGKSPMLECNCSRIKAE
jgi:hypothetical protein